MKKLASYLSRFDVSRETIKKLDHYHALLLKWQKAINLVSNNTIKEAEKRHFLDSAQLYPLIDGSIKSWADIGCGAGFPGLVLAILRPEITFNMIESDQRKCTFMQTVSRETSLSNVVIYNERIENVTDLTVDGVSARALKDLETLFGFVTPYQPKVCIFPKGQNFKEEIDQARQSNWQFDVETVPSITDDNAQILKITNLLKV